MVATLARLRWAFGEGSQTPWVGHVCRAEPDATQGVSAALDSAAGKRRVRRGRGRRLGIRRHDGDEEDDDPQRGGWGGGDYCLAADRMDRGGGDGEDDRFLPWRQTRGRGWGIGLALIDAQGAR